MQIVEKNFLSLKLAVKNKDSCLFLCAHPHCSSCQNSSLSIKRNVGKSQGKQDFNKWFILF